MRLHRFRAAFCRWWQTHISGPDPYDDLSQLDRWDRNRPPGY